MILNKIDVKHFSIYNDMQHTLISSILLSIINNIFSQIEAQEQETSVADSLYKNVSSLEAIFHILDADQSGKYKNFKEYLC